MTSPRGGGETVSSPSLLPLAPEFRAGDHQYYVDVIETALGQGTQIRNIALTGGYGVGKSSVLQQVAKLHERKVVEISLSTLGLADGDGGGEKSTTNRIQKEVVKQLLYRERPHKMPGSRFRRLARFGFWRSAGVALIGGAAAWLTFFLAEWTAKLSTLFHADHLGLWFQLFTFLALTGATMGLLAVAHNRVAIKGVKLANADIALASDDTTYFDQFLDEIIYFFEVTKRDVVIFEDIDRFDDPHIFETLRALNTLLNASKQLSRDIRFVYAIKDSIFALLGSSSSADDSSHPQPGERSPLEVAPSNRTKFFDLVVPVVPFITHRNARELMAELMRDVDPTVNRDLLDLAAQRLPDMRLLKNVRNEFVVFREKVAIGDDRPLSADGLFAMMLYKNVYLEDFELIPTGQSQLDHLYAGSRRLVRSGVAALDSEGAGLSKTLASLDSANDRSAELGRKLTDYAARLARHCGLPTGATPQMTVGGTVSDASQFSDPELWRRIWAASDGETFVLRFPNVHLPQNQLSITKADLAAALDDRLSAAEWDTSDRERLMRRINQIAADRGLLLHARYVDLIQRHELTSSIDGGFEGILDEFVGESGLARELVEAGFIDQNFALYTSNYYADRVSLGALNFLLHNVDRNVMDVDYLLSKQDVTAILAERGDTILHERCAFNVTLLDALLQEPGGQADRLLEAMTWLGPDAVTFWSAYVAGGTRLAVVVERLARTWPDIFTFIVAREDLDDGKKTEFIDLALKKATSDTEYRVNEDLRSYLEGHAAHLKSLTAEASSDRAAITAALFGRAGVRLSSLGGLTDVALDAIVHAEAYEISRGNLKAAVGGNDLALDHLRQERPAIYAYLIENIGLYLEALGEDDAGFVSLVGSEEMPAVLSDIVERAVEAVDAVVERAGPSAEIEHVTSVPTEAWGALADSDRFPATYENVQAYLESAGTVDRRLGGLLTRADQLIVPDDVDQAARIALALRLLGARDGIPDPETRVGIVDGLELENHLVPAQIEREVGPLGGVLLEHGFVEDTEAAFTLVTGEGWETVGPFVERSEQFETYMTPALIPVSLVPSLLRDNSVRGSVKDRILDSFDEYIPTEDVDALSAAAEYARASRGRLTQPQLLRISNAGVDREISTDLLSLVLTGMTIDEIRTIGEAIGGAIKSLFARDGKRPKLKGTDANRAIVQRLQELDEVNSFKESKGEIEVNLKRN